MFFDDEKDFIEDGADIKISEDGSVTWEEVLNDSEDDVSSLKNKSQSKTKKETSVDLGDDLELIQDSDDEVDEAQLTQILQEDKNKTSQINDDDSLNQKDGDDEFDIDAQLANVALEEGNDSNDQNIKPRKEQVKKPFNMMPVLISALFAVCVAGALWWFMYNPSSQSVSNNEIAYPVTKQDEMDNITKEDIAQRSEEDNENEDEENIPVINEEEVDSVKPELNPLSEKKEVIDVKPSGRPNPFLPIAKYASVNTPKANIDYDSAGVPKPPETYGPKEETVTKLLSIAVSGIMYDDVKPSAIVTYDNNDYFVQKGDRLDDYRVLDITKNSVTIALGKNIYKANIGEEFKISSEFYGSAIYLKQEQGGGRQYYSVQENAGDNSSDKSNGLRYVSEDEVIIKAR